MAQISSLLVPTGLPDQFKLLLDLQAQSLDQLKALNTRLGPPPDTSDIPRKPQDFEIPAAGLITTQELEVIAIMISVDTAGPVTFNVGNGQKLAWFMGANTTVFISLTDISFEVNRGLNMGVTVLGGNFTAHVWAYPR